MPVGEIMPRKPVREWIAPKTFTDIAIHATIGIFSVQDLPSDGHAGGLKCGLAQCLCFLTSKDLRTSKDNIEDAIRNADTFKSMPMH
jgi:hypothetical protein